MEDIRKLVHESQAIYYADTNIQTEFDPRKHKKYNADYYFQVYRMSFFLNDLFARWVAVLSSHPGMHPLSAHCILLW